MQPKPSNKLREELGEDSQANHGGEEDDGCSSTSYFCWENLTYYQLQKYS